MYEEEYEERFYRRKDIHTTTDPFVWKILRWNYGGGTMNGSYWDFLDGRNRCYVGVRSHRNLHDWKSHRKYQWKLYATKK
jgi:hypothetical protein